jgi:hypothetical protein
MSKPAWHNVFVEMIPAIGTHAKIAFAHLRPEARAEAIQEAICNACCAVARLAELDKLDLAYPTPLARYAVAQVRDGRKVGCKLNIRDVLSPYCQQRKKIVVERLDRYDADEGEWREALIEDKTAGPSETAAARIDIGDWFATLPRKKRRIAEVLASGECTKKAARKFRVSAGRISQLRREFQESWAEYQGELASA